MWIKDLMGGALGIFRTPDPASLFRERAAPGEVAAGRPPAAADERPAAYSLAGQDGASFLLAPQSD